MDVVILVNSLLLPQEEEYDKSGGDQIDFGDDAGEIDFGDDGGEIDFGDDGGEIDFGDSGADGGIDFGDSGAEIDFGDDGGDGVVLELDDIDTSAIVVEDGGISGGVARKEYFLKTFIDYIGQVLSSPAG